MDVDVIIRTLAEASRRDSLLRAIESLLDRQHSSIRQIIVLNGTRSDPELVNEILDIPEVVLACTPGTLRSAFFCGRDLVTSPYFAFLDDDDEYMPHGVDGMVDEIEKDGSIDLVVTNGFRIGKAGEKICILDDVDSINNHPVRSLLTKNWLYNCGSIYRSSSFPSTWFEDLPSEAAFFFEWTWIACKASLEKKIKVCDTTTFIYNNTPNSVSKSWEMTLFEEKFLQDLESFAMDRHAKKMVRRKRGQALHDISDHLRQTGDRRGALRFHLMSLVQPGGWRFAPYSRHLLASINKDRVKEVLDNPIQ